LRAGRKDRSHSIAIFASLFRYFSRIFLEPTKRIFPDFRRTLSLISTVGFAVFKSWRARQRGSSQIKRKYLAVHAAELAVEPNFQILRRHRRSLLLRLEHAHRSAVENHVHRAPRLGSRRSPNLRDAGCLAVPGARSIVGTGDIFGDRFAQPIHVLRRGVCLSKRDRDAGFVEGIEDGDP